MRKATTGRVVFFLIIIFVCLSTFSINSQEEEIQGTEVEVTKIVTTDVGENTSPIAPVDTVPPTLRVLGSEWVGGGTESGKQEERWPRPIDTGRTVDAPLKRDIATKPSSISTHFGNRYADRFQKTKSNSPPQSHNTVGDHTTKMAMLYAHGGKNITFKDVDAKEEYKHHLPHKKVFIYSMPRSGSTFMGSLFKSSSNDTVYMYEVFAHFKVEDGCGETKESLDNDHIADLIREMYTCDFDNIAALQNVNWWLQASSSEQVRKSCVTANPPSKMVVLKDIKSFWGYHIDYLANALGSGLRFIWLVRDVRGWVSSWLYAPERQRNFYTTWKFYITDFYSKYYSTCQGNSLLGLPQHITDLMEKYRKYLADKSQPAHLRMGALWTIETLVHHFMLNKHLKDNYFLVKYEDISRFPLEYTEKMYSFIGFTELPIATKQFVQKSTSQGNVQERHGSSRNSTQMVDIWKSRLNPCQIKQLEVMALPATKLFGYDLNPYAAHVDSSCKLDIF